MYCNRMTSNLPLILGTVLIPREIMKEFFFCNLPVCKGACCVYGEDGPPLSSEEAWILSSLEEKLLPFLDNSGRTIIKKEGFAMRDSSGTFTIPLTPEGRCAAAISNGNQTLCSLPQAFNAKILPYPKPVSCHLYPVRIEEKSPFSILTYDRWSICNSAKQEGKKRNILLIDFVMEALEQRFGPLFIQDLKAIRQTQSLPFSATK